MVTGEHQRPRFTGMDERALDDKGRVVLPARYRAVLQASGVVVTPEDDGFLGVWLPEDFLDRAAAMKERERNGTLEDRRRTRAFFAYTVETTVDGQGRIMLPSHLREFAGIERDVMINGDFDHLEIWDLARWRAEHLPVPAGPAR